MLEKLPEVIGLALRHRRAGLDHLALARSGLRTGLGAIRVSSLAFLDHAPLPAEYTADGIGLSPPLQWLGVPANAEEVVLIVEDADAPTPWPLVHAIVTGLPPADGSLAAGALPSPHPSATDDGLHAGRNSYLRTGWLPPDPPPGHGQHRYVFQVFALGPGEPLPAVTGRSTLLKAVRERGLAGGCLVGTCERPDGSIRSGREAVPEDSPLVVKVGDVVAG